MLGIVLDHYSDVGRERVISYLLSGLLPIAAGFAVVQLRRKQFGPTWSASKVIRSGECMIRLIAGPFEERTICLLGVPAVGAQLSVEDTVRVAPKTPRGHYEVVEVRPDGRRAVAWWWLDG
jgi:hypothetical protein